MDQWLAKINKLANWQAAIVIAVIGFIDFFTGLTNPFMHDDIDQIVNNPVVHHLRNIRLFFEGGTFYHGNGIAPLSGAYYRPLMTTVFSLLYTMFGLHPLAYHLFQLALCIGVAILIYLFLRYSFNPLLALLLSLVFLVHPINSQDVYAIPSIQEPLFLFFGMLALLLLLRSSTMRSLPVVAICLLLSLLSKETGVLFVIIAALYLFWFDRKRLLPFAGLTIPLVVLWLVLRIHAVKSGTLFNVPIERLSLAGRLLTLPAIVLFYLTKLIFPLKLASGYYWVYPTFSIRYVLLPLLIVIVAAAVLVYVSLIIRRRVTNAMFMTYLFFSIWLVLGLLPHLQIAPLDMTVSETWFYFPLIGALGMLGVALVAFQTRVRTSWFLVAAIVIIGVLGFRTALRGLDWKNEYTLAQHDLAASKEDYGADDIIAVHLAEAGKYSEAKPYALLSTSNIPRATSYSNLGRILIGLGDYPGAVKAFNQGSQVGDDKVLVDNIAGLSLIYGEPSDYKQFYTVAIAKYPHDAFLWTCLAIFAQKNGDKATAKDAIANAVTQGLVLKYIYDGIMNDRPFTYSFVNKNIYVP